MPIVRGDASRLAQLFQSLTGNAVKFRRADVTPEVRVRAARDGDWWHFVVADNGIGVDEKYHARIFEMFQRLHGHGQYEGTGLGPSMCQKIVGQHGGQLWVESTCGVGSAFHFTLPVAEEA